MSTYSTFDFKGERKTYDTTGFSVCCPVGYKYLTITGQFCSKGWLTALTGRQAQAFNDAANYINGTEGEEAFLTGTSLAATNVTPFRIKSQRIHFDIRNNYSKACNLTVYEIYPRQVLPDIITGINAAAMTSIGEVLFRSIIEGLGDKLGDEIEDDGLAALHTVANGTEIPNHVSDGTQPEMSLKPPLTIFASSMFGQLFNVVSAKHFYFRPGDKLTYIAEGPSVAFPDGIEPYLGAETLGYDFTKIIVFQLQGDVGHIGAYTAPGASGATDLPHHDAGTYTHYTADKQTWHGCNYSEAFLDVVMAREAEFEIYDAQLIEPAASLVIDGAFNHDDMLDTVIVETHDLN